MNAFPRVSDSKSSSARFTARLVVGVVLLNLFILALAALSLVQNRNQHQDRAVIASQNISQVLEQNIAGIVARIDLSLLSVSDEINRQQTATGRLDRNALQAFMAGQLARQADIDGLRVTNAQGDVLYGTGVLPDPPVNAADRDYFIRLRDDPEAGMLTSKPLVGRINGKWVIFLARRLTGSNGVFAGVVFAVIPLEHLQKLFSALDLGRNGLASLRESDLGMVVRHPEPQGPGSTVGDKRVSREFLETLQDHPDAGTFNAHSALDNIQRTFSYRRIRNYPGYLFVGLATEDYLADWRREVAKTLALVAGCALVTLLFSRLLYRSWQRREDDLAAVARQEAKFRTLIDSAPDALVIVDAQGIIAMINQQTETMFGYARDELIGQTIEILMPERYRSGHAAMLRGYAAAPKSRDMLNGRDLWAITKEGREFPVLISLSPIETEQGTMITASIRDVTERKAAEQRIEFLAYHDTLTKLPNRLLVLDRLNQATAHAHRSKTRVALLFLDLDKFKTINDSLGHSVGDALLIAVASRLRECVRETDTISRLGGDEFLIVLPDIVDAEATTPLLNKLMDQLERPFDLDGREVATSISVGIAIYPDDGDDFETLLKKADTAMYQAKDAGRNTYRFFDEHMNVDAVAHLRLRNGLRRALEQGEFVLHYQPQIDLASNAVIGAEALIRWNHPDLGMVPPRQFIAIAEDTGLIVPIGEWVLREACRQAATWRSDGFPDLIIAVNLSAIQFKRGNLAQTITAALQESGINPALLELELTESILIHDTETVLATVQRLKLLGVKLSIDDFGTGYSSLSYLKRFNVDKLKIDQSFIRDLATDPDDAAIVRAIIQMAQSLNLRTIAEGVEDQQMLDQLRIFNCDEAQGYHFARPMPAEEFASYLARMRAIA